MSEQPGPPEPPVSEAMDIMPFEKPAPGLDTIGWFIATLHQMIGHDKTAAVIGAPAGDKAACLICQYEKSRTEEARQAVIRALARPGQVGL